MTSTMTSSAVAVAVAAIVMTLLRVSSLQDNAKDQRQRHHNVDDSEQCSHLHGKCHSDRECCLGYTCSTATDQQIHLDAAGAGSSGTCVEDTTSLSCQTDDQCGDGSHCIGSDSTGQGHCQSRGTEDEDQHETLHMYRRRRGGLGSSCESTADCNAYTMDGQEALCCQDVRRGRQGTKRMCDRLTPISNCID